MKTGFRRAICAFVAVLVTLGTLAAQESTYQPKFPGDPARSDSEAAALGYMRTVLRAQRQYKQKYNHYATSLTQLVHIGSFTRRMTNPDRGDYTVGFHAKKDKDTFELAMTPKNLDAQHRSFYADEDGVIHADEHGPANENSEKVK
jgi:type II secretory pathway pseudopilin PulG